MILAQLPTYNWRLSKRRLRRNVLRAKLRTQKYISVRSRRIQRTIASNARHQYYPTTAARDLIIAARHNEDIVLGSLLLTLIVSFSFGVTAANLMLQLFIASTEIAAATGFSTIVLFGIAATVIMLATIWLTVLLANLTSLPIMQGANRKLYRSLRYTVRHSLAATGRVTLAWIMLGALLVGPIFAGIVIVAGLLAGGVDAGSALPYLVLATVASAAWFIGAAINYTLAPYVAFFEQDLTLMQTFARSRQLVRRRGRMFILSIYLLLALFLVVAEVTTNLVAKIVLVDGNLLFGIILLPALLFANGVMAAFYRKRRLARTR